MVQLHDLIFPRQACPRTTSTQKPCGLPRARARAPKPRVSTVASETCLRKSSTCMASSQAVSKQGAARSCVAPVAQVASGSRCRQMWRQKMRRHWLTWRQGASWHRKMWCQNVASGSNVASPDVASKRGVTCPHGVREPGGVAKCGVKTWRHVPTGVREPDGVARCGVKTWRHLPTWRQRARWRRQMWRQNVASLKGEGWRCQMWRQNMASLARAVSGGRVALPDVAIKCGVTCPRGVRQPDGTDGAVPGLTPVASLGFTLFFFGVFWVKTEQNHEFLFFASRKAKIPKDTLCFLYLNV